MGCGERAGCSRKLALTGGSQTGQGAHTCEEDGRGGEITRDRPWHGASRASSGSAYGSASKNHHRPRKKGAECEYCDGWRKLIRELDFTRCKRGHCTRSARAKNAATTPMPVPLSETGVQRIYLTAPLEYAVAGVHLEPCEMLLRYLKLATSSHIIVLSSNHEASTGGWVYGGSTPNV
jgi:hypothetical protein